MNGCIFFHEICNLSIKLLANIILNTLYKNINKTIFKTSYCNDRISCLYNVDEAIHCYHYAFNPIFSYTKKYAIQVQKLHQHIFTHWLFDSLTVFCGYLTYLKDISQILFCGMLLILSSKLSFANASSEWSLLHCNCVAVLVRKCKLQRKCINLPYICIMK